MFLKHYRESKSKNTARAYKLGLEKFEKYYGKTAQQIYEEHRANKASGNPMRVRHFQDVLAKWNKELIDSKTLSVNSAKSACMGVIQFFSFCGEPIKVGLKSERTQKTYILSIEELQRMYSIADLRGKVILSLGLDLAWRIGDFLSLKKSDIPNLNAECPIPIQKTTAKESELSCTFISCETVALLKEYMPNLPENNEYLFPNRNDGAIEDILCNSIIQELATQIHMKIPEGKHFSFHAFRKRFLSTATSLGIDEETKCLLVGKSIDSSHEAYYGDAKLQNAFISIRVKALPLIPNSNGNGKVSKLSEEVTKLTERITLLEKQNILSKLTLEIIARKLNTSVEELSHDIGEEVDRHKEENT
jgi:integrase